MGKRRVRDGNLVKEARAGPQGRELTESGGVLEWRGGKRRAIRRLSGYTGNWHEGRVK